MWGNTLGWVLSAILLGIVAPLLWPAIRTPPVSEPSGVFPDLLSRVALPADPRLAVPALMGDDCDAGELYRKSLEAYQANPRAYDTYHSKPISAQKEKPQAIELLARATRCSRMRLFARTPAEVLNYKPDTSAVEAVEKLGNIAIQIGLLHGRDKNAPEARRYFEAAYALGYHLYNERLAWSEFTAGINLMMGAAAGMAKLERDTNPERAKALEHFATTIEQYKLKQFELYKVVSTIDTTTVGRHGGDILALARSSPEPMWRGEAILALGRMKYNTPRRGDQLAAAREVQRLANDPDPVARAAANAASALTIGQYRALR